MDSFYVFIFRNDVWIYIVSVMGLVWFINELGKSQRHLRQAVFGLEKERGRRARSSAIGFILFFSLVLSVVYYVNSQVIPTLPQTLFKPATPTPDIFTTPLSSPTPLGAVEMAPPTATVPLVPTITLPGQLIEATPALVDGTAETAIETPTPSGPTSTPFVACTLDLNISEPRGGGFVSGNVSFSGTADFANFGSYTLEANGPETSGQWASLTGRSPDRPVRDSFLASVNLSQWRSGPYLIRLRGTDSFGTDVGYCVIQVTLNN